MDTLTIAILTKNEEIHMADVIANAQRCTADVLIVDSGSTDRTVVLAEERGARVVYRPWDGDFGAQRNFALNQTDADWILYLDADERLEEELIQAIRQVLAEGRRDRQYSFIRKVQALGFTFTWGIFKPDEVRRLFPRAAVRWEGKVHERPVCSLPVERLPGFAWHRTYNSWQHWLDKAGQYTSIWAKDSYAKGKRISFLELVFHVNFAFFKAYFIAGGILGGAGGLVSSWQHMFYTLLKYGKLYELQRRNKRIDERSD